jgi:tetratricopeptide (TPR) repeat protein
MIGFENMAKNKISRKELLKKEDEFISLSSRVSQYISAHAKQFKYGFISIAAIVVIVIIASIYVRYVNKKALTAYNIAYKNLVADVSANNRDDTVKKSMEEIDRLLKEYGWTKFATLSIPQLAYLKFGQGKYDEAISLYKEYLERDKTDSIYRSMSLFGLAAAYEAKKDYQSSISYLQKIIDGENDLLKEEAMFSLGRIYSLSGQSEKSKNIFKDFVDQFKNSPLLPLAKAGIENSI